MQIFNITIPPQIANNRNFIIYGSFDEDIVFIASFIDYKLSKIFGQQKYFGEASLLVDIEELYFLTKDNGNVNEFVLEIITKAEKEMNVKFVDWSDKLSVIVENLANLTNFTN